MTRSSTLNGVEKAKTSANGWTLVLGCKNGLQQEVNRDTSHVDTRNHFEVLHEEGDLAQDPRTTIVKDVVACTPEILLKDAILKQEPTC